MELSLGLFFGNQGPIGQPLCKEISLLKCSSRLGYGTNVSSESIELIN